jgi:hypothetical protein
VLGVIPRNGDWSRRGWVVVTSFLVVSGVFGRATSAAEVRRSAARTNGLELGGDSAILVPAGKERGRHLKLSGSVSWLPKIGMRRVEGLACQSSLSPLLGG